jgi:tetratricopeptide (TPR) repeat protein
MDKLMRVVIALAIMAIAGCATTSVAPTPAPVEKPAARKVPPGRVPEKPAVPSQRPSSKQPSPRAVASLHLTEQARMLLAGGKPDDAIRVLEQAVMINPSNGKNYYYLAEAWIQKGNSSKALEFNNLAAMYLKNDPEWIETVNRQRKQIKQAAR